MKITNGISLCSLLLSVMVHAADSSKSLTHAMMLLGDSELSKAALAGQGRLVARTTWAEVEANIITSENPNEKHVINKDSSVVLRKNHRSLNGEQMFIQTKGISCTGILNPGVYGYGDVHALSQIGFSENRDDARDVVIMIAGGMFSSAFCYNLHQESLPYVIQEEHRYALLHALATKGRVVINELVHKIQEHNLDATPQHPLASFSQNDDALKVKRILAVQSPLHILIKYAMKECGQELVCESNGAGLGGKYTEIANLDEVQGSLTIGKASNTGYVSAGTASYLYSALSTVGLSREDWQNWQRLDIASDIAQCPHNRNLLVVVDEGMASQVQQEIIPQEEVYPQKYGQLRDAAHDNGYSMDQVYALVRSCAENKR